ncbi:hypothetical protein G7Y79_00026g058550 [Physcia stellaris]|nr:hypothetical protein G7Y79_00026g058550 [Physcia stellaris]
MSGIAHHLVRRGLEATQHNYNLGSVQVTDDGNDDNIKSIPIWGVATLWVTLLVFMFAHFVISYTYGSIVATLTTIETPTATAFTLEPAENEDSDAPLLSADQKPAEKTHATEPELFLIKSKPITSKIRTTVKHLKAQAGPWSRFRGLQVAIVYHLTYALLFNFLTSLTHSTFVSSVFAVLTHTVLSRLGMTWTHVVMSNPSPKSWIRRYPSIQTSKKIFLPTAIWAAAQQFALYIPALMFSMYGLNRYAEDPSYYHEVAPEVFAGDVSQVFMCGLVAMFIVFAIVFPAEVTLTRVQASMLPEEDEAIVPFDRTFGGKVEPEILGGRGCVSMLDAWKTFDWAARIRLIKLYVKVFALQVLTTVLFVGLFIGELRLIMGDDLPKVAKMAHDQLRL